MTEQLPEATTETVWWINAHEPLGRLEQIKKALFEAANRGTYIPDEKLPFSTSISVAEIATLADPALRQSLMLQHTNNIIQDPFLIIPVATVRTREFKHAWRVRRNYQ